MKAYKYQDETFQLDDSKGCYVQVTYKYLKGYLGVNLAARATDQNPYVWDTDKKPEFYVTRDGLKYGFSSGVTFEENLDALCRRLVQEFRLEEARQEVRPQEILCRTSRSRQESAGCREGKPLQPQMS